MSLEPKADYYNTQINTIKTDFFAILGGYKQKYIDHFIGIAAVISPRLGRRGAHRRGGRRGHFTTPSDDAATKEYDDCIFQMQTKNQELFDIANNIQTDIDALDDKMRMMTTKLDSEKTLNNNNSNLFEDIQTTNSGSKIMIDDYKTAYNTQYYYNAELVIGIVLMIGISSKIFRK